MAETAGRASLWKIAIVAVVAIELFGGLSGWVSNSGYENGWFAALQKPAFMPPGWTFGVVWPILYALLGISVAMILAEPPSDRRRIALTLFLGQLALNFAWSPIFFAAHKVDLAFIVIVVMTILSAIAALLFARIRAVAGWLMAPYLAWLFFAAYLTWQVGALNPDAARLAPSAASADIPL